MDAHDPVPICFGHVHLVQIDNAADIAHPGHVPDLVHDDLRGAGVQGGDGLIAQQQGRVLHQGPGNAHPLFLPTGKLPSLFVEHPLQADHPQEFQCLLFVRLRVAAQNGVGGGHVTQSPVEHVLKHGKTVDKIEGLENHPNAAPDGFQVSFPLYLGHVRSLEQDCAFCGVNHAVDAPQHGGFPSAAGADDDHHFPRLYREAHILHSPGLAVIFFQMG